VGLDFDETPFASSPSSSSIVAPRVTDHFGLLVISADFMVFLLHSFCSTFDQLKICEMHGDETDLAIALLSSLLAAGITEHLRALDFRELLHSALIFAFPWHFKAFSQLRTSDRLPFW
jgi:hypothetical protein